MFYDELKNFDPEVYASCRREFDRQQHNIELIASENIVSEAVLLAAGTPLTNKYAEGYPSKRYYGGCQFVDEVEEIACERAKKLFGAEHANVQPHSGASANLAVFFALLEPGDTVLSMSLAEGGHLSHGSPVNISGKYFNIVSYGVDTKTQLIDYDEVERLAKEHKPKLILAGASAYPRKIDFARFRSIADEVGAYFMVDMAHYAGLIAAGVYPNPVPYADIVTSTTHKSLRGPRGGFILMKAELERKINSAVFPGLQGGPLMHVIAGKAVAFQEALQPEYKVYQQQVVKNAKVLCDTLISRGFNIVSGTTESHVMLVDLQNKGVTGRLAQDILGQCHITCNRNAVPNDPQSPFVTSGIRLGTPAMTTRGFKEEQMVLIANLIADAIENHTDQAVLDRVTAEVKKLTVAFPVYQK